MTPATIDPRVVGPAPPRSPGGRVRLIDVANASGVTKSIASRVLSGDESLSVRDQTRRRVTAAADELGYQAHAGAKALAGSKSKALALLLPDLTAGVYSRIARGAYQRARECGYVVMLAEDQEDSTSQADYADLVSAGRIDGLLIASTRENHPLLKDGLLDAVPHVFVNRTVPGSDRNVSFSYARASRAAYEHLYDLGHRKIGHISGARALSPAVERDRGFDEAALAAGAEAPLVVRTPFTEAGGLAGAHELLRQHPEITAVFAGTFSQAVGALKGIRELGLRIPDDISLLSNDDLPLADYLDPPLSSMAMPLFELGGLAVDVLIEQLTTRTAHNAVLDFNVVTVTRASTAPPARPGRDREQSIT